MLNDDIFLITTKIYVGKYQEALIEIEEIKEKFSDSLKLINLRAICLIN